MGINPYVLLALVLAWGASCGLAYYKGGEHREDAITAERARLTQEDRDRAARLAEIVAGKKADNRANNRAIENEVSRYAATDPARAACFDDDGLRLFNAAARGVPVSGGGPAAVQPRTADREGRDARRRHPDDEAGRRGSP